MVKSRALITASAGIFIMLVAAAFLLSGCTGKTNAASGNAVNSQAQQAPPGSNGQKPNFQGRPPAGPQIAVGDVFKTSELARFAYAISDNSTSADEEKALSGFSINKTRLADGSLNVTLTAHKADYHDQSFIVKPGETLYFVETSLGDDSGDNDYRLMDDIGVLVGSDGKVAQLPDVMMAGLQPTK